MRYLADMKRPDTSRRHNKADFGFRQVNEDEKTRLAGVTQLLRALVKIARAEKPEADAALPTPSPEVARPKVARRA